MKIVWNNVGLPALRFDVRPRLIVGLADEVVDNWRGAPYHAIGFEAGDEVRSNDSDESHAASYCLCCETEAIFQSATFCMKFALMFFDHVETLLRAHRYGGPRRREDRKEDRMDDTLKTDDPLKALGKQLSENVKKQPGWGWLLVVITALLFVEGKVIDIVELRLLTNHIEISAVVLTFVFYQLGDALDKVTFKKRDEEAKKWVERVKISEIDDAQNEFGITDGVYDVSMKILEKAKQDTSVYLLNEMAKVFRSLIILALAAVIWFAFQLPYPSALVPLAIAIVIVGMPIAIALMIFLELAYLVYPWLKNLHRRKLYKTIVALLRKTKGKTTCHQLGGVRMFFWEGTLVGTAAATAPVGTNIVDWTPETRSH